MTQPPHENAGNSHLKQLLQQGDEQFWAELWFATRQAESFAQLVPLMTLRKRALAARLHGAKSAPLRVALIGGCTLYPLHELVAHFLAAQGLQAEIFVGDYDNYIAEVNHEASPLYQFKPQVVVLVPSERRVQYPGGFTDSRETQQAAIVRAADDLLQLCGLLHQRSHAEVVLFNFPLPAGFDPGSYRTRTLASDWNFRKSVNTRLGLEAPPFVHLCDVEFLAARLGGAQCRDDRAWYESKQPFSPDLMLAAAREVAQLVTAFRGACRKVLVLDLDNTLWGGVIGDDGLTGIELGDTSPRGEAFKDFQRCILRLRNRGVLLAVCSKNDYANALEPFEKHPEMVLRKEHFVAFEANWEPKSDNLRRIAAGLNLGLDSLVFVDDNPAEIEIVRQFAPEVATLLLTPDPADYVRQLQDCRYFEPITVTAEDTNKSELYRQEHRRQELQAGATDMAAYLASLQMEGRIHGFRELDVPRIAQLINKSNQFNVTTRRRTEAEVRDLLQQPDYIGFTLRLADRLGDHGLIGIVICESQGAQLRIDTLLMSCRVLNRQAEHEMANEIVRIAREQGCREVLASYIPTAKNGLVRDLFDRLGFTQAAVGPAQTDYVRQVEDATPFVTAIQMVEREYGSQASARAAASRV